MVLLGAGASMDAGLPSSHELTDRMLAFLAHNDGHSLELAAAQFVYHTLAAEAARRRRATEVDVERFVASVQLLGARRNNPIGPFVDRWSSGVLDIETTLEGVQEAAGRFVTATAAQARNDSDRYHRGHHEAEQVGAQLINVIQAVAGQRRTGSVFASLDTKLRSALFRLLAIDDPTVTFYLKPLLRAAIDQGWTIATLNYDAAVEICATALPASVSMGVQEGADEEQLSFSEEGALALIKLHGSIEWSMRRNQRAGGLTSTSVDVFRGGSEQLPSDQPAVIFGEGSKLSAEGPFLDLFMEFSRRLSDADTLLIIGYSMRDAHVNEVITRWMNRSDQHQIVWIDPELPVPRTDGIYGSSPTPEAPLRAELLEFHHDHPHRVVLISETARQGIHDAIDRIAT